MYRITLLTYPEEGLECSPHFRGVICRCILRQDQFDPCPGAWRRCVDLQGGECSWCSPRRPHRGQEGLWKWVQHHRVHVRTPHRYNPRWYGSFSIKASTIPLPVWTLCWARAKPAMPCVRIMREKNCYSCKFYDKINPLPISKFCSTTICRFTHWHPLNQKCRKKTSSISRRLQPMILWFTV